MNFFWWPQRNSDQLHLQVAPAEQAEERGKGIQEPAHLDRKGRKALGAGVTLIAPYLRPKVLSLQ